MPRTQTPFSLEYILLGLLDQRPMHGYDLHRKLSEVSGVGLVWQIKQSQLYALLDRMETEGLLESRLVTDGSRPPRKEFSLTGIGRQTFKAWMVAPVDNERDVRQEFLARLYFARQTSPETAVELIEEQICACLEWVESLEIARQNLSTNQRFDRLVYEFRLHQVRATLEWLELCRRSLS